MEIDTFTGKKNMYIHYKLVSKTSELDFVQMGYHYTHGGYEYGPMVRDHYLIHFVMRGSGKLTIHGDTYAVFAGEGFLISPYEIASYVSDIENPWEYYWVGFTGFEAESFLSMTGFKTDVPVIRPGRIDEIINAFAISERIFVPKNIMLYKSILYRVLHYLTTEKSKPGVPPIIRHEPVLPKHDCVGKIVSIITTSYSQRFSVGRLADMLSINRNYLCKIFKNEMGVSIKEYLTEYRLSVAASKMRHTRKPVMEVAKETGFQDSFYFSRVFKQRFGVCPTGYRLLHCYPSATPL